MAKDKYDFSAFDDPTPSSDSKYDFSAFDKHPKISKDKFHLETSPVVDPKADIFQKSEVQERTPEPPQVVSPIESFITGAANPFNIAPALHGAIEAVPTAMNVATGTGSPSDILDAYRQARDTAQTKVNVAKTNPKAYFAGGLVPGVLGGAVGKGSSAVKSLVDLFKSKSYLPALAPETAAGALTGAGYGAASGLGNAVSSGEDLPEAAKDIAGSTVGGAILGWGIGKLANTLEKAPKELKAFGNEQAMAATGAGKTQFKLILGQDIRNQEYAASIGGATPEEVMQKTGRLLSEPNSITDAPIITGTASAKTNLDRATKGRIAAGQKMNDVFQQLDSTFTEETQDNFFNPTEVAKEIETQLMPPKFEVTTTPEPHPLQDVLETFKPLSKEPSTTSSVTRLAEPKAEVVQKIIDTVKAYGETPITLAKAQELKNELTELANYKTQEGPVRDEMLKQASGIVNKAINDSIAKVAEVAGTPELAVTFKNAKDLYGAASIAQTAAQNKVAAGMANQVVGLRDLTAGLDVMTATHSSPAGLVTIPASMALKRSGHGIAMVGAKGASNALSWMGSNLVKAPKEAIKNFGQQMIQSGTPLDVSLGNILVKAADRDDVGRNALMFATMQNPSYRDLLKKYMGIKDQQGQ